MRRDGSLSGCVVSKAEQLRAQRVVLVQQRDVVGHLAREAMAAAALVEHQAFQQVLDQADIGPAGGQLVDDARVLRAQRLRLTNRLWCWPGPRR